MPTAVAPSRLSVTASAAGAATSEPNGALLWSSASLAVVVSKGGVLVALGTATASGAQSATVEVDFGVTPKGATRFAFADASANLTTLIVASQSAAAPTGRSADENEMTPLVVSAACLVVGVVTLNVTPLKGSAKGIYRINYTRS